MSNLVSISLADRAKVLAERDARIEEHVALVQQIAWRIHHGLPPGFDLDDLIGAGQLALVRAATTYCASHGLTFRQYASYRIDFGIRDSVRRRNYRDATMARLELHEADLPERNRKELISAEAAMIDAETHAAVGRAVEQLPSRLRNVIEMSFAEEKRSTVAEIGETLGVSPGRVCQLRAKALERLRLRLG